jgi:hypothetical protein
LNRLSWDEFTGFIGHFYTFMDKAYRRDLKAAAYVVMSGCSDDCFMDFRKWLVTRGKSVYQAALENPDSLLTEYDKIPKGDIPLWEYYFHNTRFGPDASNNACDRFSFPPKQYADPEHQWSDDDPESIRRLCPRTFEAYWEESWSQTRLRNR